ncbi:MAG: prolyl oligopeptidase family serine peptidase [Methylacidiphilales bacterium]|nr:prolyl oligopeptidase family serine peptidase [Candidatus Methylacidiphilales bacterium]
MASNLPPPAPHGDPHPSFLGPILFAIAFLVLASLIFTVAIKSPSHTETESMPSLPLTYPATRTVPASDTYFGVKVSDPYRWLEDGKSPEVQSWLTIQNKLTRSYLDTLPGRDALRQRYHQLLYIDTISAPGRAGDRYFYMKRRSTDEKAILYWRPVNDPGAEHVLIDPNQFVTTNNASLGETATTLDGRLLAYTLKPNNADEATLYVKDVASGNDLPGEVIDGAKYADPSWLPDGSGFVYTYLPPAAPEHPEDRPGLAVIRYHKLGTDPKNDPVLHDKTGNPTKFVSAYVSRDGKWIFFVQQNGWDKNDLYYQPLNGEPTTALVGGWKPIVKDKNFLYSLYPWKGDAYILTNEDATRYHLFKAPLDHLEHSQWREIVPESPTIVLQGVSVIGDHLVLDELDHVTSRIEIRDLDGHFIRTLDLPGLGSVSELSGEPDHDELFYGFVNFTTPPEIFQTSISNPEQKLWDKIKIPVDPSPYVVEQVFFPSKDGTKIPMFIVHRKDIILDGSTPFLLTGYGGFGISETPYFSPGFYPFLEAGGGYAVVNLRGGGEFGEQWHQDGMLLKKQNVFDDCIAAAEYLVNNGYTSPNRLAFRGGSNGGLLAGAMLTQRPDLFRAIICEVPLLDMIRYDQFGSGKTWVPEYGSPDDPEQFKALYAYSPYHHVVPGTKYPAVLFCTAANDDRVDPMHARKMAAELQADTVGTNPILVRVETQSGHGGGDQVKKTVEYGTDIWGFLIHELGAKTP